MGKLEYSLTSVTNDVRDFPAGAIEAKILNAEVEVSSKGNPMVAVTLEVVHPKYGTATFRDWLVPKFPPKVARFWQAVNHLTSDQLSEFQEIELDTDTLIGATLIAVLAETTTDKDGISRKNLDPPFYYADTELDKLPYLPDQTPF